MIKTTTLFFGFLVLLISFAPKISSSVQKSYPPLDYREEVQLFGLKDALPAGAESIGTVKIGDSGFSTNCGWDVAVDKAKLEARKVGGNAIKIIKHIPPSPLGSTCHRLTATILRIEAKPTS